MHRDFFVTKHLEEGNLENRKSDGRIILTILEKYIVRWVIEGNISGS
jgi:DNA-binding CsgD family transcriptional regulator